MPALAVADQNFVALDYAKIKRLREKRELSMDDAAKLAGFTNRQRWHEIESGRSVNITLDTLGRIAKALGVKPSDLLDD